MSTEDRSLAVVGMGCRLPGDVDSPAALWRLLVEGRDAVGPLPAERAALVPDAGEANPAGGYLRDVTGFDADFFGVSRREADVLDPQHRLLLEVAWEALEHAGMPPARLAGSSTGVYVGISYDDYMRCLAGQPEELEGATLTNGYCVAAGRISYLLGLHGPCIALDTACSSSLVALHLAGQALRARECDLALVGGVNLVLWPTTTRSFSRMGMLSRSGRCRPFDVAADGFVRSEGCAVVAVKRLADARRDGDRILAVVRGSAVNQDGRSDGLAAPSADAQQAVYQQALTAAGVRAGDVGLIEAHGTGTPVGDPTEFTSLTRVYGDGPGRCALGSVKSNLGHLEPAAGVTGLVKAVLCLWHGLIPGNLHFTRWSPTLDAEPGRFFVPTGLTEWPAAKPTRLAAVSSFGFSGTNAHVVLEQGPTAARGPRPPAPRQPEESTVAEVVVVPAASAKALPVAAERLADWLETDGADVPLRDVAHTLALRRSPGRGRLGVVATSRRDLVHGLRAYAAGRAHPGVVSGSVGAGVTRRPVWVFSGQGSQWAGMGRELLAAEPAFAATLAELDPLIRAEADFSVLRVVRDGEPVLDCAHVQPALFAVQLALAATWRAHGVEPAAVIGHSMGEVAAAVVSGALSTVDGVRVICRRSALLSRIAGSGVMASVGLDSKQVEAELAGVAGRVTVAVHAAPGSTVVAGDPEQVRRLTGAWEARGVPARLVAVDVASHSPQVDPLLDELAEALAGLSPRAPRLDFYSTVLDEPSEIPAFDAAYWCANLRRAVRFADAVAAAAADRHSVFVEVSPHPVVTQAVSESLRGRCADPVVLPTLRRDEDARFAFRTQLAAVHCVGVPVDWSTVYGSGTLVDVPSIAFDRRRHWVDAAARRAAGAAPTEKAKNSTEARGSTDIKNAESTGSADAALPGRHLELPGEPIRHAWRGDAGTGMLPWLADHRVHGDAVLPGSAYCAVALTAGCAALRAEPESLEVVDVQFRELLRLAEHTELHTTLVARTPDQADCVIFGRGADGDWVRQATATLRRVAAAVDEVTAVDEVVNRHPVAVDPATLYEAMRARGIEHGPVFAGVESLHRSADGDSFLARVRMPELASPLPVHPVLLDICAQVLVAALIDDPDDGLLLPVQVGSLRVLGEPTTAVHCLARITATTAGDFTGDVRLLDAAGRAVLSMRGLRIVRHGGRSTEVDRWFLEPAWQPAPLAAPTNATGAWVVVGDCGDPENAEEDPENAEEPGASDDSAGALACLLRTAGASATTLELPVDDEPLDRLRDRLLERWADVPGAPHAVVLLCAPPGPSEPAVAGLRHTRRALAVAQAIVSRYTAPPRLYVVTRGAQPVDGGAPAHPAQAALRGVVRVLAHEHPDLRATLVDIDGSGGTAGLRVVLDELLAAAAEDEVAWRGGVRHVAHLEYAPLSERERTAATTRPARHGVDRFRLRAGRLGDLERLELAQARHCPPGTDEVEVRVRAAGVNFRDVLTVMGMLPGDGDLRYRIGFECSGVVTAVGDGVRGLNVGDEVLAVDLRGGAFGSFVTVPAAFVGRRPTGVRPVAAAGLPTAFLTAWYALRHVARLSHGERVLIHSATGGTGLAAVAVARRLGAEVLATAGSEEKREYLRGMGIRWVMDSRSLDFAAQAREATGGEGVDVVLNSLSGPAIRAGLEALRPFGRFVELGVRDIIADAELGLAPLRHNITLSTVDLIELQRSRPERFTELLDEVLVEFTEGRLGPLPCRSFPIDRATDAFRLMAGARHLGKLVLTVPEQGDTRVVCDGPPVHPDGAYLVTGGLRGVGLATARWLAAGGAGHVVLNGRRAPGAETELVLAELRAAGTRISVVLGDVAEPGTAERMIAAATDDGLALRGVVHSAMVLADATVANVTDEQLDTVWRPKVTGAWLLHRALDGHAPDWFVLYSSMSSLLGNPGQAAYAAANAWLDGFAAWRSAHGLPTLAVNWGPWGQTGVATDFADRGYRTIPTGAGLRALGELLTHRRVRTGVIPGEPSTWIRPAVRTSSLFQRFAGAPPEEVSRADDGDVRATLAAASTGLERRIALETYLSEHIRSVLRLDGVSLDPQTPLRALGFDSLLSMELRVRLESGLDVKLASNFVWKHQTVAALAAGLAEHMGLALDTPKTADREADRER